MPRMARRERCGAVWSDDLASPYGLRKRGTVTGNPTLTAGPSGRPATLFDGTTDWWKQSAANFRASDSAGSIDFRFKTAGDGTLFCSCDEGSDNDYLFLQVTGGYLTIGTKTSGTLNYVRGGTTVTDDAWHHAAVTSSGTAWGIVLDGSAETLTVIGGSNNGNWFADVSNRDSIAIGLLNRATAGAYFPGAIAEMVIESRVLSADEISAVANRTVWNYWQNQQALWTCSAINDPDLCFQGNGYDMTGVSLAAANIVDGPYGGKAIDLDGVADYYLRTVADWRNGDSIGAISVLFRTDDPANYQAFFSSNDEAAALDDYFIFYLHDVGATLRIGVANQVSAGGYNIVHGGTDISAGRWYHAVVSTDGSAYSLMLDGVAEALTASTGSNNGHWLADVPNRDSITIGVRKYNATNIHFNGAIADVRYFNNEIFPIQAMDLHTRLMRRTA